MDSSHGLFSTKFSSQYSFDNLCSKISKFKQKVGVSVIFDICILYNVMIADTTTIADKTQILCTLGYFIAPIDLCPDFVMGIGFLDDFAAIAYCLKKVSNCVTINILEKAKDQVRTFFPTQDIEKLLIEKSKKYIK